MKTKELVCPKCAAEVSTEPPYWVWMGKYYCSYECARMTMGGRI